MASGEKAQIKLDANSLMDNHNEKHAETIRRNSPTEENACDLEYVSTTVITCSNETLWIKTTSRIIGNKIQCSSEFKSTQSVGTMCETPQDRKTPVKRRLQLSDTTEINIPGSGAKKTCVRRTENDVHVEENILVKQEDVDDSSNREDTSNEDDGELEHPEFIIIINPTESPKCSPEKLNRFNGIQTFQTLELDVIPEAPYDWNEIMESFQSRNPTKGSVQASNIKSTAASLSDCFCFC